MRALKKWLFKAEVDRVNCIFCRIAKNPQETIHYEDEKYFVITDINKASAVEHLLVITKEHIDNALTVEDPKTIDEMHQIGRQVLTNICEKEGIEKNFRFGFHLPPFNSIDHIHLHCFIEPLSSWKHNKLSYGFLMSSI